MKRESGGTGKNFGPTRNGFDFYCEKIFKTNKSIICYKSDQIHGTVALQPQPFQSHVTPL